MDTFDYSAGSVILIIGIVLGIMAAYPFAKAGLLHLSTRLLKFQQRSYWKSFFSVLIGIGVSLLMSSVCMAFLGSGFNPESMRTSTLLSMVLSLVLVPIAEAISVFLFLRQSVGKTIGAVILTHVFILVLLIVLFILIFIVALFATLLGANG